MKSFLTVAIATFLLSGAAKGEQRPGCLKVDKIKVSQRTVQPGGTLNIRVRLQASHCVLQNDYGAGTTATLFVEPRPGFESTVGLLTYSQLEGEAPYLDVSRTHALETTIAVKPGQVANGNYSIPVFLNYQAVDEHGAIRNESLQFALPVAVSSFSKRSFRNEHPNFWENLAIAGAAIVIVALAPVLIVECMVFGNCWTC
jgi:hypothetical protein